MLLEFTCLHGLLKIRNNCACLHSLKKSSIDWPSGRWVGTEVNDRMNFTKVFSYKGPLIFYFLDSNFCKWSNFMDFPYYNSILQEFLIIITWSSYSYILSVLLIIFLKKTVRLFYQSVYCTRFTIFPWVLLLELCDTYSIFNL